MRWPFANWLRGAPGRDDPSPDASEAHRSAPAPDPGPRIEARPAAWRDLPPVQRAVGELPLTAPSAVFARDLAGRRLPDPILAPLGHDVAADGPAGLVSGIAAALVQRAPVSSDARPGPGPMPSPAVSGRGGAGAKRAVTSVATLPPVGAAGHSPLEAPSADATASPNADGSTGDVPGLAPRALPVVPLATATPAIAATRVADATAPAPILVVARTVASVAAPLAPSLAAPGASGPPPAAADVAGSATATGSTTATNVATGTPLDAVAAPPAVLAPEDEPARPVVARRTLGESRRLGLGAPLVGPPPSAGRDADRGGLVSARLARHADAPGLKAPLASPAPAVPAAAATSAPLPRLVVARRPITPSGPVALPPVSPQPPEAADPGMAGAADAGSPEVAGGSLIGGTASRTRPLSGHAPIGISRLAREDGPAEASAEGAAGLDVGALPLAGASIPVSTAAGPAFESEAGPASRPEMGAPEPGDDAGSRSLEAVARVQATPAVAPLVVGRAMRSSLPTSMATLGQVPRSEPAPVVTRVAIGRSGAAVDAGDPGPVRVGRAGRPAATPAPPAAVQREMRAAVGRGAAAMDRDVASPTTSALPLMRSAAGAVLPDRLPAGGADAVSWTAGAGFTTVAPIPGPFVQRAVVIDEVTATPAGGAESGAASAGQTGQAGVTGAAGAGTDYEELAEHVYDRIRARLTTELLLDRERAGMLVDG